MTTTPKPTRTPKLSGLTIAALLDGAADTTLVVHLDGKLDTPSLREEPVPATTRIVRNLQGEPCNRLWADTHLVLATAAATEDGTSTKLGTLRAAAARLANDELLEAYQEQLKAWQAEQDAAAALAPAVVPTPPAAAPAAPDLAPMRRPEPQTLREWTQLLDAIDLVESMGLLVVADAA